RRAACLPHPLLLADRPAPQNFAASRDLGFAALRGCTRHAVIATHYSSVAPMRVQTAGPRPTRPSLPGAPVVRARGYTGRAARATFPTAPPALAACPGKVLPSHANTSDTVTTKA